MQRWRKCNKPRSLGGMAQPPLFFRFNFEAGRRANRRAGRSAKWKTKEAEQRGARVRTDAIVNRGYLGPSKDAPLFPVSRARPLAFPRPHYERGRRTQVRGGSRCPALCYDGRILSTRRQEGGERAPLDRREGRKTSRLLPPPPPPPSPSPPPPTAPTATG